MEAPFIPSVKVAELLRVQRLRDAGLSVFDGNGRYRRAVLRPSGGVVGADRTLGGSIRA